MKARWTNLMLSEIQNYFSYRQQYLEQVARARALKSGVLAVDMVRKVGLGLGLLVGILSAFTVSVIGLICSYLTQWALDGAITRPEINLFFILASLISLLLVFVLFREKTWMQLTGLKQKIETLGTEDTLLHETVEHRAILEQSQSEELEAMIEKKVLDILGQAFKEDIKNTEKSEVEKETA